MPYYYLQYLTIKILIDVIIEYTQFEIKEWYVNLFVYIVIFDDFFDRISYCESFR